MLDLKYGVIQLSDTIINKNQKLVATIEVTNTGPVNAKEAVLWYISAPPGSYPDL